MANLFDGLRDTAHAIVTGNMGYAASWTPSAGGPAFTGKVLFNKPTQRAEISDEQYDAIHEKAEYLEADFPGLADSIDQNGNEVLVIEGVSYSCYKADRKFDGKTIIVRIDPV